MANKEVKANKENNKNKKSFFKGFKAELKKVVWPTPKQLLNSTVAVLTIVLLTAAIVFVLDITFESMNKYGVNKLKQMVNNTTSENASNESSENNTAEDGNNEEDTTSENKTENEELNTTQNAE